MINSSLQFRFGEVYSQCTDLILDEHFVWFQLKSNPKPSELKQLRGLAEKAAKSHFKIYINVDSRNETHMRFAAFFGFVEVRREGAVSVQVLEGRKKWPRLFLH